MFQFRRFPAYCYFIHSTLTRYCRAGFPHSDIHGSRDICSSPWLFAACRVLHRLLMPRHSPCALSSLTSSSQTSLRSLPPPGCAFRRKLIFAPLLLLPNSKFTLNLFLRVFATCYGLHSCSQNYAGISQKISLIVVLPLKFHIFCCCHTLSSVAPSVALLFFVFLCSVLKVQK